ncbi:MAG: YaiI/YqxD family protein [Chloroflexales bacterium]|jgi:uncharacterized protein
MMIWVDADACPTVVKDAVFRASARLHLPVCLVANHPLAIPNSPLIRMTQVTMGSDMADAHIVQHVAPGDLVITADIPLASQVVARGAIALDPRGDVYTAETVGERLALRDLMEELRGAGMMIGGPTAYCTRDRERFAQSLDRLLPRRPPTV